VITYTLTVNAQGALLADPSIQQRFDREIMATLAELGALGQARVVSRTPTGVSGGGGGLRGSIFTEAYGVPGRRGQIIASSVYYAPIVEKGRTPGARRPPLGPILLWVTRKLGISGPSPHVAFLVSRKIGQVGTTGVGMFAKTATELQSVARSRFQALQNRIAEILR
jgi:hypothetical protein